MTITTPIDYVTAAQAWVLSHARLVLTILALVALLVGAWWLLRKALESLKPEGEADVQRALRAWRVIARASRNPTMPRELRTSGNERVEERSWGRVRGLIPTSTHHVIILQPARGLLGLFQRRVVLVANHLIGDARLRILYVNALGLSLHEGVWWPDDDLADPKTRAQWATALREPQSQSAEMDDELQSRIHAWYLRLLELSVAIARGITAINDAASNLTLAMTSDLNSREAIASQERAPQEASTLAA